MDLYDIAAWELCLESTTPSTTYLRFQLGKSWIFFLHDHFATSDECFNHFAFAFQNIGAQVIFYDHLALFPKPFSDYKVDIWPEREFINFFTLTGACHYLKYDNNRKFYTLSAREVENFVLFQNHYLEFREIRFTLSEILSITIGNKVIVKSKASAADWCRILLCKFVDKFRVSYSITFSLIKFS